MVTTSVQQVVKAPQTLLERALITSYLVKKGYHLEELQTLPANLASKLLTDARSHASLKLVEIEARDQARRQILNED